MSKESESLTEFIDVLSKRLYKLLKILTSFLSKKHKANQKARVILKDNFQVRWQPRLWFSCARKTGGRNGTHIGKHSIFFVLLKVHKHEIFLNFFFTYIKSLYARGKFSKNISLSFLRFSPEFRSSNIYAVAAQWAYAEPNFFWEISQKVFFPKSSQWSYQMGS
jgi:hypothetical protein